MKTQAENAQLTIRPSNKHIFTDCWKPKLPYSAPGAVKVLEFLTRKSNLRGHLRWGRRSRTQKMRLQTYHNPAGPDSWFSIRTAQPHSKRHPGLHIHNEWCRISIGSGSTTTTRRYNLYRIPCGAAAMFQEETNEVPDDLIRLFELNRQTELRESINMC